MKLFILKRKTEADYDEMREMVIRAKSNYWARLIAAESIGDEPKCTWLNVELSTCKELKSDGKEGIICSDFKAG